MAQTKQIESDDPLKIIGFKVDGFRKLKAVEMEFTDKGLTEIRGKNKAGKSSIIDAIEWLIEGNKVLNKDIINDSSEKIRGELKLNKYIIKRTYGKSSQLEVKNVETNTLEKGEVQNFLNTFINELTFNPRPFLDKTLYQMLQFCLELFADSLNKKSQEVLGMSFADIDKKLTTLEQDRLFCGREVKKFGEIVIPEKADKIDIADLNAERKLIEARNRRLQREADESNQKKVAEIEAFNKEQRNKMAIKKEIEEDIDHTSDEIKSIQNDISDLEIRLKAKKELLKERGSYKSERIVKFNELPDPEPEKPLSFIGETVHLESTAAIDKQIQEAGAINEKADAYQRAIEKKAEKEDKENEYNAYDGRIKDLREKKLEVLRSIDTGVEGLLIGEDGLYYKGNFSENWSDAEGLMISSELCLARMPKLRAVFMDRFESFDKDMAEEYRQWAIKNNVLAICTKVDNGTEVISDASTFYIVDGQLNGKGR